MGELIVPALLAIVVAAAVAAHKLLQRGISAPLTWIAVLGVAAYVAVEGLPWVGSALVASLRVEISPEDVGGVLPDGTPSSIGVQLYSGSLLLGEKRIDARTFRADALPLSLKRSEGGENLLVLRGDRVVGELAPETLAEFAELPGLIAPVTGGSAPSPLATREPLPVGGPRAGRSELASAAPPDETRGAQRPGAFGPAPLTDPTGAVFPEPEPEPDLGRIGEPGPVPGPMRGRAREEDLTADPIEQRSEEPVELGSPGEPTLEPVRPPAARTAAADTAAIESGRTPLDTEPAGAESEVELRTRASLLAVERVCDAADLLESGINPRTRALARELRARCARTRGR